MGDSTVSSAGRGPNSPPTPSPLPHPLPREGEAALAGLWQQHVPTNGALSVSAPGITEDAGGDTPQHDTPQHDSVDAVDGGSQLQDQLQDQLLAALSARDEHLADLQRIQASFENYRKRVLADQELSRARQQHAAISELLPVLDDLDRLEDDSEGTRAVSASVAAALERLNLSRIDQGDVAFDPMLHEAATVRERPSAETAPDSVGAADLGGTSGPPRTELHVVTVLRCGWRQDGTVLRPALVEVQR